MISDSGIKLIHPLYDQNKKDEILDQLSIAIQLNNDSGDFQLIRYIDDDIKYSKESTSKRDNTNKI